MHLPTRTEAAVVVAMAAAAADHTMEADRMAAALTDSNSYNHSYRGGRNARRVFDWSLMGVEFGRMCRIGNFFAMAVFNQ